MNPNHQPIIGSAVGGIVNPTVLRGGSCSLSNEVFVPTPKPVQLPTVHSQTEAAEKLIAEATERANFILGVLEGGNRVAPDSPCGPLGLNGLAMRNVDNLNVLNNLLSEILNAIGVG